jgi:AcrR family transcriptional regulator
LTYHHGNLRKELLERAVHVIAEQGIEALSLRALSRDLGVSHAAPARHFADKAELLRALATEGNQRFIDYVLAAAEAAGDDPLERYAAMGKAYIRFSIDFPAYYRTLVHPDVSAHADAELRATSEQRKRVIEDAARLAQAAGWLPDETVEDVVMFSIATVRGVAAMLTDPLHGRALTQHNTDMLIENMVRLIIDPAHPQKSLNPHKKGRP